MSAELSLWVFAFVAAACLLSGFAHGALGFGFPILATPLVALVIDIKSAIGLIAPVTLVLVIISACRGGGILAIARRFWYLPAVLVLGSWLGTRLLLAAPPEPFLLVLALVIVVYLNLDRLGRGSSRLVQRLEIPFGMGLGFMAGIFESIANVAGPLLLVYFMLLGLAPAQVVQTLNLCFSLGKGTQVITWAASGAMSPEGWAAAGALIVPSVLALFAGMRVRNRIDAATYRLWLRKALWVMTALLVGQFVVATKAFASDQRLFASIEEGKELVAEGLLLRGQADVNARNSERETPLHRAVEKGMKSLAQMLLKAGADVRARSSNGETALHLAALHSDHFFVELLLGAGADPKLHNDNRETPLMWAALGGQAMNVQRLLDDGADANLTDLKGNLPLHAAADGGYADVVKLLLPRTADPAAKNRQGQSARDHARARGHGEVAALLELFAH